MREHANDLLRYQRAVGDGGNLGGLGADPEHTYEDHVPDRGLERLESVPDALAG